MSDPVTTSTKLLYEGVGLPPVWREDDGFYVQRLNYAERAGVVDLLGPQTALGVTLLLDAWKAKAGGEDGSWTLRLALDLTDESQELRAVLEALAARVTHIGMDHAMRRYEFTGAKIKPGSLAVWVRHEENHRWAMHIGKLSRYFYWRGRRHDPSRPRLRTVIPALEAVTDPIEALRTVYQELC